MSSGVKGLIFKCLDIRGLGLGSRNSKKFKKSSIVAAGPVLLIKFS